MIERWMLSVIVLGAVIAVGGTCLSHLLSRLGMPRRWLWLALMIMKGNGPASGHEKVWTVSVPALKVHKSYVATFHISPFKYADRAFTAVVDRSDEVKESDESNNERFDSTRVIK